MRLWSAQAAEACDSFAMSNGTVPVPIAGNAPPSR